MPAADRPPPTPAALRREIEADPALKSLLRRVTGGMSDDPGHDLGHALRVASWTVRLGGSSVERRTAIAASLLHDVVNVEKDSAERETASARSAEVARRWLAELDFADHDVEAIAGAIRDHSFSRGATPSTLLGRALQDADRLEALGVLGWMRAVACGTRMGAAFFDADDPWSERRQPDDRRFTLDHYFVKLRTLEKTMQTPEGRQEARRRTRVLEQALRELGREIGVAPPFDTDSAADSEVGRRSSDNR